MKKEKRMDKEFYQAEENNCTELASQIEDTVPACRVNNLGFQLIVFFDNKSVATVYPLTADSVDLYAKDFRDEEFDLKDVSIEQCLNVLREMASLTEETNTGAVAGYDSARAFAPPGQKSNRGTEQSKREGWSEIKPRALQETENRSQHPFGEDPLGHRAMDPDEKKNSEGKRKSALNQNCEKGSPLTLENSGSQASGSISENQSPKILFDYLADMLPVDNAEILDGNVLGLEIVGCRIFVMADNGAFTVKTVNGNGELIQQSENVSVADLITFLFSVCDQLQKLETLEKRKAEKGIDNDLLDSNDTDLQVEVSDVWSIIRELAKESGKSDDVLRNPDLFSLRQGLVFADSPFRSGRRFSGNDFSPMSGSKTENVKHPRKPIEPLQVSEGERVCSWCGKVLGDNPNVQGTTHGICPSCKEKMLNGKTTSGSLKGSTMHDGKPVSLNECRDISKPYCSTLGNKKLVWTLNEGATLVDKSRLPKKLKLNWSPLHGVIFTPEDVPTNRKGMWKFRDW